MARLIDYEGKLAVDHGWLTRQNEPVEDRWLSVSNIEASRYPVVVDRIIEFTGNMGRVYNPNTSQFIYVDTTNWESVVVERPIKKPRKGKDYDWVWSVGKWRKEWK